MGAQDRNGASSSTSETARAQVIAWAGKALPVIAGGIGFAGFVSLLGAGVVWMRFDAAQLPADQALAKFPRGDLIGTGAVTLVLFLLLGLLAVLLVYLLQTMLAPQPESRQRTEDEGDLQEKLTTARSRLKAIDSDLDLATGKPPVQADTAALLDLRAKALSAVVTLERLLVKAEENDRKAEERERKQRVDIPTTANQFGLLVLLVIEAIIVIWTSHAETAEKTIFYIATPTAALIFGLVGGVATDIGKARPGTLIVGRRPNANNERRDEAGGWVRPWSLLQAGLVIGLLVFFALLVDKWLVIPIVVAVVLAAGNLAIGRLHPRRFFWYGCSIFASVALFGAVLTYSRIRRDPSMQPAAVALNDGRSVAGLWVTETKDRVYLARVDIKPGTEELVKNSGRIFWLSRKNVRTISIGSLQHIADANKRSEVLAKELTSIP
jgi:hypothetical protein